MSFSGIVKLGTALVGLFMMLDASLAFLFGRRYISLWLGRAPGFYRWFILRLLELPRGQLLLVELASFPWVWRCSCLQGGREKSQ